MLEEPSMNAALKFLIDSSLVVNWEQTEHSTVLRCTNRLLGRKELELVESKVRELELKAGRFLFARHFFA